VIGNHSRVIGDGGRHTACPELQVMFYSREQEMTIHFQTCDGLFMSKTLPAGEN